MFCVATGMHIGLARITCQLRHRHLHAFAASTEARCQHGASLAPIDSLYLLQSQATAIVASQALISASFQIVKQAIAQNFFPRFNIKHTNEKHEGQIYIAVGVGAVLCTLDILQQRSGISAVCRL